MRPTHPPVQALGTITLHYHQHALRVVIDTTGDAHFTGADLARILGYNPGSGLSDPHRATLGHYSTVTHGRRQQLALTDVGLDYLLSVSQKPEAAPFHAWIDGQARPAIRRYLRQQLGQQLGDVQQQVGWGTADRTPDDLYQELLAYQRLYAEVVQERDTALSRLAALTPARSRARRLARRFLGRGV